MDEMRAPSCSIDGCTLDGGAVDARIDAFRTLFARGLRRRTSAPGRAEWIFAWSAALEADARALAVAEQACCSFFTFDITHVGDELRWITTAPPDKHDALALLDSIS
jgi:hypothetical protein